MSTPLESRLPEFASDEIRAIVQAVRTAGGAADGPPGMPQSPEVPHKFWTVAPHFPSLTVDRRGWKAQYLVAEEPSAPPGQSWLLVLEAAPFRACDCFPRAAKLGEFPVGEERVAVFAVPFSSQDHDTILRFVRDIAPEFLPRPQGALAAIAAGNRHPEVSLPAVFAAYQQILERTGRNLASTSQLSATREMTTEAALDRRSGENPTEAGHTRVSIRHLFHAGMWAAIRSGWRAGYNAEADHFIITGNTGPEIRRSVEAAKEAIRHAAGYTKFTTDTSRLFTLEADPRHPQSWSEPAVEERFQSLFSPDLQHWILSEFAREFTAGSRRYFMEPAVVRRLAVKFGPSLLLNEELYDFIGQSKRAEGFAPEFDFEPSLDEAETLTTPRELIFYMHWLKARGRAAQLVPPNLGFKKRQAYPELLDPAPGRPVGLRQYAEHHLWPELLPRVIEEFHGDCLRELAERVSELAAVATTFDGTLSIHSGSGKQAAVLEQIGQATRGRVNYKISGELQLQLFDVLSEQAPDSPWRMLLERMVQRAEEFAAAGAFGAESALAAHYRRLGLGSYLGDAHKGRVNGNLFLVFWLGNMVGSRDGQDAGGDTRFFKEKLDELPAGLLAEVRRRNSEYILWLAKHLLG